jgi:hypothetical protein
VGALLCLDCFDPLNGRESLEESNGGGKNPTVIRG